MKKIHIAIGVSDITRPVVDHGFSGAGGRASDGPGQMFPVKNH